MQPSNTLPDPRKAVVTPQPGNTLAQQLMNLRDMGRMVSAEAALDAELLQLLEAGNDQAIEAALANTQDQAEARVLNDRLRAVIARGKGAESSHCVVFALPIVLVAGSRTEITIPGELPRIEAVRQLLIDREIIAADADLHLSNRLVERDALLDIKPSTLLQWRDTQELPADGLQMPLQPAPITFKGDGVYLRYLVGTVIQRNDHAPAIQLNAPQGAWSMALSKLLGELLDNPILTLFPLPRAPQTLLAALEDGRHAQQDIRFQVFASNTLRSLRDKGETPVAVLSTHENGELRVTIGAEKNGEEWTGFVWPLSTLDRIDLIQQMMVSLLRECHHDDIRVIPEVLPTVVNNLPYFPLPTELPASTVRH
jgi:hypothetical protein